MTKMLSDDKPRPDSRTLHLLDQAAQRWDPDPPNRADAAVHVLLSLDALNGVAGFRVGKIGGAPTERAISFHQEAYEREEPSVRVDVKDGELRVGRFDGQRLKPVQGLVYSHLRKRLEGPVVDGEPVSAMYVVMRAVLDELRELRPEPGALTTPIIRFL